MTNAAFEQFILENQKEIYSFCLYLTGNKENAEDLYQDTFLKAIEMGNQLQMEKNPKSYLLSIAIRLWKNKKRKFIGRKRITSEKVFVQDNQQEFQKQQEQSPEALLLQQERKTEVLRFVNALPQKQKIVILLYYMEELSIEQISRILKIPKGTVKSRLYQARKQLELSLKKFDF